MKMKTVSLRLRTEEFTNLQTLVESEGYYSKSELIRELIRRKWDEWAERVIAHAKQRPEDYERWEKVKKEL